MSTQVQPNTNLKAAREARGWSQVQVARYLEIAQPTYQHWESGVRPSDRNLKKLCHLFRKTKEELGFG